MLLIRYVTETQLTVFFRPDIIIVGSNSAMKTLCIALYMLRSRYLFKSTDYSGLDSFFFLFDNFSEQNVPCILHAFEANHSWLSNSRNYTLP
jgi:hypothetical protein